MGLSLEKQVKKKDKTCSPPWKHIPLGYVKHKIAPTVWTFDAELKNKQSIPGHWRRWAIIIVAFASCQRVPHHRYLIFDLIPFGIFSTHSSSKFLLNRALIDVDFSELVLAQLGVDLE